MQLSLLSESVVCWSWEEGDYGSLCVCLKWDSGCFRSSSGAAGSRVHSSIPALVGRQLSYRWELNKLFEDQGSTLGPALPCRICPLLVFIWSCALSSLRAGLTLFWCSFDRRALWKDRSLLIGLVHGHICYPVELRQRGEKSFFYSIECKCLIGFNMQPFA